MISSLGEIMRKKLKQARDLIWCGPGDCAAFQRILCRYRSYGVPSKKRKGWDYAYIRSNRLAYGLGKIMRIMIRDELGLSS